MEPTELPTMIPVESSNVHSVGYNEKTNEMFVQFLTKSVYKYKEVPKVVYDALFEADSVGCYLNKKIKPNFAFEKVLTSAA